MDYDNQSKIRRLLSIPMDLDMKEAGGIKYRKYEPRERRAWHAVSSPDGPGKKMKNRFLASPYRPSTTVGYCLSGS